MARSSGRLAERAGQPVDVAQAWKLRVVNKLSFADIAKQLGCSKAGAHAALQRLHEMLPDPEIITAYEGVEAQLLTAGKARLLRSLLDEESIEKASLNNRAFAFSQLFNAHRLATHQSTANLSVLGKIVTDAESRLGIPKTAPAGDVAKDAEEHK
jgi:hypothetical protein